MNVVAPARAVVDARAPRHARATLGRLARAFGPFRQDITLAAALVILQTGLGLLGPYLMAVALDRFVATDDTSGLAAVCALMFALAITASALAARSSWLVARASLRAVSRIRRALFAHLQTLPVAFFSAHPAGQLSNRLSVDVEAIAQAAAQSAVAFMGGGLSMAGIVLAMFALDRRLALAALLLVPVMVVFTGTVARRTREGFRALQATSGDLASALEESIAGHEVIRAFGREAWAMDRIRRANDAAHDAGVRASTWALVVMPLTTVLGNVLVVVLAMLGGWLALDGKTTVGVVAAFITYAVGLVQPLRQMSNIYNTLQAALASAERVFEMMDASPERDADGAHDLAAPLRGDVRFEHVTFRHREGGPRVLEDLTLEAAPGETLAIVGPTGAGKTTIVSLLARLHDVEAGVIRVDGVDVRQIRREDLRRRIGLVPQETWLFSGTVRANIRHGRPLATDAMVDRAAEIACADGFIRQLPCGWDTVLQGPDGGLSQGQRQLLAIARVVLADPAILVLDEATSSVDTRTEARIQAALARLTRGRTCLVVAHRLSTVRDASRVVVLERGAIVATGTHEELLAKPGVYRDLFEAQLDRR